MHDLRNLSADYDANDLVNALAKADVVVAHRPEERGGGSNIIKGRELLERVISTQVPAELKTLPLMVANTMQAAMIAGALKVIDENGMQALSVETFGRMLVSVSDRGELH